MTSADPGLDSVVDRHNPPSNEIPASLLVDHPLLRTDDIAVTLQAVKVFSTGVELDVSAVSRSFPRDGSLMGLGASHHAGSSAGKLMLLGVEFADGRTATNVDALGSRAQNAGPKVPLLTMFSGRSSGKDAGAAYFLTPLPPPGPVVFVFAWPEYSDDETTFEFNGSDIAAAAANVEVLWPAVDDEPYPTSTPTPPDLPPRGWFKRVLGD